MIQAVQNNLDRITEICRLQQVKSLYLFGSAATETFRAGSDVDFLIEYKRDKEGLPLAPFDYFDFLFALEDIVGLKVDLVVKEALRNKYFIESMNKGKILLYAE
jgi:predicted nucleotidyltransferase